MALKAGSKGPRSEAQGCARTTGFTAADLARPTGGWPRNASVFPCAMNSRFRTGADKGNPTV